MCLSGHQSIGAVAQTLQGLQLHVDERCMAFPLALRPKGSRVMELLGVWCLENVGVLPIDSALIQDEVRSV